MSLPIQTGTGIHTANRSSVPFIMILPGLMIFSGLIARLLYPGIEQSDLVYPMMIDRLLPIEVKGPMLAAEMAAVISSIDSTLDSTLTSGSTLVTMDFVRKFRPQGADGTLTGAGRITILAVMAVGAAWTPVIGSFSGLFEYLQERLSYLVPPLAAVFVMGLFRKRANGTGGLAGLVVGHGLAVVCLIAQSMGWDIGLHFLILAAIFFAIACLATVVAGLMGPSPDSDTVENDTYSTRKVEEALAAEPRVCRCLDHRVRSAGLLRLNAWLVIAYR